MEVISKRYALKNGKGLFITSMFLKKNVIVASFFFKTWAIHSQYSKYKKSDYKKFYTIYDSYASFYRNTTPHPIKKHNTVMLFTLSGNLQRR